MSGCRLGHEHVPVLNLLKYLTFRTGMSMLTAYIVAVAMGSRFIRWMKAKQGKGQPIRTDGIERHVTEKAGTPTMGGFMILAGLFVGSLLLGRPAQRPRLGGADHHRRLRRAGLHGRLRQGHQADHGRPFQRPEADRPVHRLDGGGGADHLRAKPRPRRRSWRPRWSSRSSRTW
jgi:hypothetical protein